MYCCPIFVCLFVCLFVCSGPNYCSPVNGGCEQLCLLNEDSSFTCACSDGYSLSDDNNSCIQLGKNETMTPELCTYSNTYSPTIIPTLKQTLLPLIFISSSCW